jgi:hypothetical protein
MKMVQSAKQPLVTRGLHQWIAQTWKVGVRILRFTAITFGIMLICAILLMLLLRLLAFIVFRDPYWSLPG